MRRLAVALFVCAWVSACNCGRGGIQPDGGGTGGGEGGGTGAGGGGGSASQEIPWPQYCENLARGLYRGTYFSELSCGVPLTEDDAQHMAPFGGLLGGTYATVVEPVVGCDGGLAGAATARLDPSVQAGRIRYDGQRAYRCRELGRMADGGQIQGDGGELCASVLTGLVLDGQPCAIHEDCGPNSYCKPSGNNSCAGICTPRIAAGGRCNPDREVCALDTGGCDHVEDGGFECIALGNANDTCTSDDDCKSGLFCNNAGVCAPLAGVGQACEPGGCQAGLTCIRSDGGAMGTCRERARLNEPCGNGANGLPPCESSCLRCVNGTCVNALDVACPDGGSGICLTAQYCHPTSLRCTTRPRVNETCQILPEFPAPEGNCLYGDAYCSRPIDGGTTGTCRFNPRLGEPCGTRADLTTNCQTGWCRMDGGIGTCEPLPGQGQPCASGPTQCGPGLYCQIDAGSICQPLPSAGQPCIGSGESLTNRCTATAYCQVDAGSVCAARKADGVPCGNDAECASGLCDALTNVCAAPCNFGHGCGCPNGAKDLSFYLVFALALLPLLRRRKK